MMLITGATGNNGQELVRQLIALGQPIRALVRNPEEASGIKGPNVELAVGDFDRTETLDTALRNIDKRLPRNALSSGRSLLSKPRNVPA